MTVLTNEMFRNAARLGDDLSSRYDVSLRNNDNDEFRIDAGNFTQVV